MHYTSEHLDIELGGNCPVQGDGTLSVDGVELHVYFRARGTGWSVTVSRDEDGNEVVCDFGGVEYAWLDGGWIEDEEVTAILDWVVPRAVAAVRRGGFKPCDSAPNVKMPTPDERAARRKQNVEALEELRRAIQANDGEDHVLTSMADVGLEDQLWRATMDIVDLEHQVIRAKDEISLVTAERDEALARLGASNAQEGTDA